MEKPPDPRQKDDAPHSSDESTFAREGPTPPQRDTGDSVEDMNQAAEDALLRNVRPEEQVD